MYCTAPPPPDLYTLSLHDALPIFRDNPIIKDMTNGRVGIDRDARVFLRVGHAVTVRIRIDDVDRHHGDVADDTPRSEEHTSELQSRFDLVCRLLLEKKKTPSNR